MQAVLLLGALNLLGTIPSADALPDPSWKMHRLPAEFHEGVPFVTLDIDLNGRKREMRLLLDSAANGSVFFQGVGVPEHKSNPDGTWVLESYAASAVFNGDRQSIGKIAFATSSKDFLSKKSLEFFKNSKADGVLGIDFFEKRDVYLDYEKQEVWVTEAKKGPADAALSDHGFRSVPAMPMYGRSATVFFLLRENMTILFSVLGTASTLTQLPEHLAPKTDAQKSRASLFINQEGAIEARDEADSYGAEDVNQKRRVSVEYEKQEFPVLAASALGSRVYFQLNRFKAWFK